MRGELDPIVDHLISNGRVKDSINYLGSIGSIYRFHARFYILNKLDYVIQY